MWILYILSFDLAATRNNALMLFRHYSEKKNWKKTTDRYNIVPNITNCCCCCYCRMSMLLLGFLQPTTIFVPAKASEISKLYTQYKSILTLLLNTMMCTFNPFIYHLYYYYLALLHYMYNGYNITKYSFVVSSFGSVKL